MFPLPCGAGSTVPREGFDSSVIMPFFLVCCGCDTSYIVSVHIQCQAFISTLSLCRGHSLRARLAKQETLIPPGYLVSPLVCRGPWMSTVVLYCWCHSDSALVLLYFTSTPLSNWEILMKLTILPNWMFSKFVTQQYRIFFINSIRNYPLPVFKSISKFVIHVLWSKIEKVPRGIQCEKSSKDMASSRNLVSTIEAQASPKKGM